MENKSSPLAVIAIGGNSLIADSKKMSVADQYAAAGETSHHIAALVKAGYRVVITHGNGPQVGFILLRSDLAKGRLHEVPLESCVADTQGAIGYQVGQTLANELRRQGLEKPIATIVTQVRVDPADPAFADPSKPIDKDLASCLLAKRLKADLFIISTAVDKVAIHYKKPDQRELDRMTVAEAERYMAEGEFPAGSMGPKIAAAVDFIKSGGKEVIITQPHLLAAAIRGENGTHLVP